MRAKNSTTQGYSAKEAKDIIDRYIDDSAERLQKRLTAESIDIDRKPIIF
ncbi:MAG: hypothetical protein WC618_06240 [Patescibacteria group bacterium]